MTHHKKRLLPHFLIAAALVLPAVWLASPALASDDAPLYTFHPGAPGEPTWRMLKLDVTEHAMLEFKVDFIQLRCPWLMQFTLFDGEPGNARAYVGLTFDFGGGYTGSRIDSEGPVDIEVSAIMHNGADSCPMGEVDFVFSKLPVGTVYLLYATGGLPAEARVVANVMSGALTIAGESHGYGSYYYSSDGFTSIAHVGAWSPGACLSPSTSVSDGFCDPSAQLAGGFMGGAEAGVLRNAQVDFVHRPWFKLNIFGQNVGNASVTDPDGLVRYGEGSAARIGPLGVHPQGAALGTSRPYDYPSGGYSFDILASASAGLPTMSRPHWVLFAIDHQFPEEQA